VVRPRVIAAFAAVGLIFVAGCTPKAPVGVEPGQGASSVITSTTKIADAGVLGNQRRPDESCAPQPIAPEPGRPDPQRIVVLAGDQLDALCALGLQSRIVAAALPDDASNQPSYLGRAIHDVRGVGTRSNPDLAGIRAANPDLILGSQALYPSLSAISPTVFTTAAPGAAWQDDLRQVGAAVSRAAAANAMVDEFNAFAAKAGADSDAAHFQASVVQLTETTLRVYGANNFPASVLTVAGADRPQSQRFVDKPYIEISTTDLANADFSPADGDIVYLSFASPAAKEKAQQILLSKAWRKLSANRDNRVFIVNNEVWQTGQGIVAARGIVADLKWINAPIN
jgi:iron complex transport system substrate-binding protein